ncbi:DUF5302 domain-containing protein [Streptomyces sp. NPDC052101]|uniref:DUF5302 domain-containing protein n=1 Tax=Streptomyces sp. NPDC052101 TaxID=3155763 RepID=UPI003424E474
MAETPQNKIDENGDSDARRKFREALERKESATRSRKAHEEGRLRVKGMSGQAGQKRYFRRKTG